MSLQPSLRRGALAATALAFCVGALGACAAGNNAQTLEIKPDNARAQVGDIKVQNALVIAQPERESKGPAVIAAKLFNNGDRDQVLESVSAGGERAELKPAKGEKTAGKLVVPAHGALILGGKDNASVSLRTLPESIQLGDASPVTFTFSRTGDVKLDSFVVPAEGEFTKWGPEKVPSQPTKPPAESGKPSGSASPSADPQASASATGSPSPGESQGAEGQGGSGIAPGEHDPAGDAGH
ncbi:MULTISPECIES: hypothetical protein [Streptomyces]|uniref:Lipoprotein n=1 Tax=Streptomyces albus (strain ATCC 21838 / DSM 41398 / FERM P-419 / JCM 4703 / NBRC 107858) TaxID=1081613 RepID=A0A0B5ES76_STRA4|nr:hypothetical protein [Streptomyces sp. SCSIO ZS0520]AJE84509.1 lipoprotein [Streptomyces albus]AOU78819.1 lipoprotein [Streptomyces albus]